MMSTAPEVSGDRAVSSARASSFHLAPDVPIEEETFQHYEAYSYYPARLGQILQHRYRIIGKLGYGASSTVWLARDQRTNSYVALKIYVRSAIRTRTINQEIKIYRHLADVNSSHPGKQGVRDMLDSFQITGPDGVHWCLVHEPLWISLENAQSRRGEPKLPKDMLRSILLDLFETLDYLHTECRIIHTDIKTSNILMRVSEPSIFAAFERAEIENPTPYKTVGERRIYCSRDLEPPKSTVFPVLTDFGTAQMDSPDNDDDCQPWEYRAPEVILQMPWSYEIDIWNVGVLVWNLFENKTMFSGIDTRDGFQSHLAHLAEMVGYLGEPPLQFLQCGKCYSEYFEECGQIGRIADKYPVPNLSLRRSEQNLAGREKDLFLQFMAKMLRWVPDERATAAELLEDPWLNGEPSD